MQDFNIYYHLNTTNHCYNESVSMAIISRTGAALYLDFDSYNPTNVSNPKIISDSLKELNNKEREKFFNDLEKSNIILKYYTDGSIYEDYFSGYILRFMEDIKYKSGEHRIVIWGNDLGKTYPLIHKYFYRKIHGELVSMLSKEFVFKDINLLIDLFKLTEKNSNIKAKEIFKSPIIQKENALSYACIYKQIHEYFIQNCSILYL